MAVHCAPLKDLLEEALVDYLKDDGRSLKSRSSRFGYDLDSSNLRIWLRKPEQFELTVSEVYRPSTFFRGTLSDGQHSIRFLSPDEHLDKQILIDRGNAGSTTPFRALVDSIELRISDCFDPPKVEAFVNAFHNIEKLDVSHVLAPTSLLSSASSATELLRRYVETRALVEIDSEMSSNESIKSQPSPVHLVEGRNAAMPASSKDSSPISQMRLATQAPVVAASQISRRPLSELESNISRPSSLKPGPGNVRNQRLKLGQPAPSRENASQEILQDQIEHQEKTLDQERSAQNCSMSVALTTTPRNQQVFADIELPFNHELIQHSQSALDVAQAHQSNIGMQMKFRRWRTEAAAGRYIPRRACKISRQQLRILESDEKWQPPLPGRDKRPGTVPIELLNDLTTKADDAVKQHRLVPVPEPAVQAETEAYMRPAPEIIDDLQSSQELGQSQWPPSPERKAPADLLPPDSSIPSADCQDHEPARLEVSMNEVQSEEGPGDAGSSVSSRFSQSWKNRAIDTLRYPQSEASPTRKSPAKLNSRLDEKSDSRSDICGPVTSPGVSDRQVLQNIQVSETPYPGKVVRPDCIAGVSEAMRDPRQCPDPSFVPSTYLEATLAKLQQSRRPANPPQQADEANGFRQQILKRKAVEAGPTVSMKRARVEVVDREAQQRDPAFAPVFQDIREYRRQALKPLTKDFRRQDPARFSISGSSDRTTQQSVASEQSHVLKALEGATRPPQVSTPITVPSSRPASKNGLQGAIGTRSATSSVTGIAVPKQLFDKFLATYVDYQGGKLYFDSAITLLKQLRLSRNDPHPSLYDDFIWHQYHSYLPYALSSIENPLSYHAYYNQHIESPSHFAKVITAACLDQLCNSKPGCEEELSNNNPMVRDLQDIEQLKDAEGSRNLISSVSLGQAQAEEPLDGQSATCKGHCEQPEEPLNPSQKSSVETWLEGTARAASPDLGTPEDMQPARSHSVMEIPPPKLKFTKDVSPTAPTSRLSAPNSERRNKRKRLSASPFAQSLRTVGKQTAWDKDEELTPFKRWAKAILSLPSEQSPLGIPQKPTQSVNIFAWR